MISHGSLSDNRFSQFSRTVLSILTDLNNALVWTVSICPLISMSSGSRINPFVTVPRAPITIVIIVIFLLHSFFNSQQGRGIFLFFSHSFNFTLWTAGTKKSIILQLLSFTLIMIRSVRLAEIWRSVCISKFQRSLYVSFSRTDSGLCIYDLFVRSNFNFMHISQWIT